MPSPSRTPRCRRVAPLSHPLLIEALARRAHVWGDRNRDTIAAVHRGTLPPRDPWTGPTTDGRVSLHGDGGFRRFVGPQP